jgi:NAD(P)H-dependent FMN reductase
VREQRQLREERRTRAAADRQRRMAASRPETTERTDNLPTPAPVDGGEQTAEEVKEIRPRRRVEVALATADAEVPDVVAGAEA